MKLYSEIKEAVKSVIEAEEALKAWKQEIKDRNKELTILISAAEKVNKEKYNKKELIANIRADIEEDKNGINTEGVQYYDAKEEN